MKKIVSGIAITFILLNLIGCSKKDELPYALPGEQYKIIYVTSDDSPGNEYHGENHQWLIDLTKNKGNDLSLIINGLEGIQDMVPALNAKQAPYVYILSSKETVLETADFEEAKSLLEKNAKWFVQ